MYLRPQRPQLPPVHTVLSLSCTQTLQRCSRSASRRQSYYGCRSAVQVFRKKCSRSTASTSLFLHVLPTLLTRDDHRALRLVNSKPQYSQPKFRLFVRYTFRTQAASVSPRDIAAIEHMLRRGRRQLEMYEDPNVRDCFVSSEMLQWGERNPGRAERDAYSRTPGIAS